MTSAVRAALASVLRDALGTAIRIERVTPLGGGSINDVSRVETTAGSFVVKSHASAPPGMFRAEADGLRALRESGTSLVIPRVIALSDDGPPMLVIEDLGAGTRAPGFDETLGCGLAELHRASADQFGFHSDNFCGATPQPNPWTTRWVDFYRDARLGHQRRLAVSAGLLSPADEHVLDRLFARLDDIIGRDDERPALIHGDLWSGNLMVAADGRPALIDPAVSFSHREAELGMMTLFGGFGSRVFAAYVEAWPLPPGWRERNALYQLYHVLNHLNLFGAGYHGQAMSIARRYASNA